MRSITLLMRLPWLKPDRIVVLMTDNCILTSNKHLGSTKWFISEVNDTKITIHNLLHTQDISFNITDILSIKKEISEENPHTHMRAPMNFSLPTTVYYVKVHKFRYHPSNYLERSDCIR